MIAAPAFWHPLSTLFDPVMGTPCSPALIALPLRASKSTTVLYAGDRMWPAVRHGQLVDLVRPGDEAFRQGEVLAVDRDGAPDLLRVLAREARGLRLQGDADPGAAVRLEPDRVLARTGLSILQPSEGGRRRRRFRLDLREACRGRLLDREDAAGSVRDKYDAQAAFYAAGIDEAVDGGLIERLARNAAAGSRVVVAGSGSGRECFALVRAGWRVTGIDFAERMVECSRRAARREGLSVEFVHTDLRRHEEPAGSLAAIVFTFDVYSFLPRREERTSLLRRMARWLAPEGLILLSARRVQRGYERWILTVQRAAGAAAWGDSHTRFIAPDGRLGRSFVHYFTDSRLRRECAEAGLCAGPWQGGHTELRRG